MHKDRDGNIRYRKNIMNSSLCSNCQINPRYYLRTGTLHYYCQECTQALGKKKYKENKEKIYKNNIKNKYGVTPEKYNSMLLEQDNKCPICSTYLFSEDYNRKPAVDHCHTTGEVRGILCGKCNTGLGLFKDNLESLEKAIEYLKKRKT